MPLVTDKISKEVIDKIACDVQPSMRRVDDNGFLHVALTPISKATVNRYYGREISDTLEPNKIYFGLRDPAELAKAADSFNGLPLLLDHWEIDAENPQKQKTVGATGTDAVFDGVYLKNSLAVHDAAAIKSIEDGTAKEISCAYRFIPDFTAGEFESGGSKIHYDFVMRDISGNHVALVSTGRAGHDVAVADGMPPNNVKGKENASMDEKLVFDSLEAVIKHYAPDMSEEKQAEMKQAIDALTAKDDEPVVEPVVEPVAEPVAETEKEKVEVKAEEKVEEKAEEKVADAAIDEASPAYKAGFEAGKVVADSAVAEITAKAVADAKEHCKALAAAAEKVKPLCGTVDAMTFDSAEAIFEFALKQQGKKTEAYDAAAYGAMVDMLLEAKPVMAPKVENANDDFKVFEKLKNIAR